MESKQFDHFEGAGRQMVLRDPIHVTVAQNFLLEEVCKHGEENKSN